jgi:enamine deaminase RidA (YjgF/YER057c/UK114 family)
MKKQVLVEDERLRGVPAVVKYGPYLFISGSEGHRELDTERINPELAGRASAQCRNSYGRIQRRLEQAGYGGDRAVWIQNFTSGQEWRLERMALWPEYFGQTGHGFAVSFGAQAKMWGINMITTVAMALTPEVEREAVVPQPEPGRAARVVRAGPFVYVIGVRGTHAGAPEETPEAFGGQLRNCWSTLEAHLDKAGCTLADFVRVDTCIRDVNRLPEYRDVSPKLACGGYVVGMPMGARGEQEIGGLAVAPGESKEIVGGVVRAGGLVFTPSCKGADGGPGGDRAGQTRQALRHLETCLGTLGVGLENTLRLDVFLRDVYFEDECLALLRDAFGANMPSVAFVGAELENGGEVELVALAGAD